MNKLHPAPGFFAMPAIAVFVQRLIFFSFITLSTTASALDYYWVGGSGVWSDHNNHWATTSGGATFHDQVPTSMDNVYFDANSFPAGGTVMVDQTIIYCMDMDWTGANGTPVFEGPGDKQVWIYGSLTLIPDMQWNVESELHFLAFDPGKTITTAGHRLISSVFFQGDGGEWMLADELLLETEVFHLDGILRTNNHRISTRGNWNQGVSGYSYQDPELYLGTSEMVFEIQRQAYFWTYPPGALDADESHIIFEQGGFLADSGHDFFDITFKTPFSNGTVSNANVLSQLVFEGSGNYEGNGRFVHSVVYEGNGNFFGTDNTVDFALFKQRGGINQYAGNPECNSQYGSGHTFGEVVMEGNGWIFGNNTFTVLRFTEGHIYKLQNGTTQTIAPGGQFGAVSTGCDNFITILACEAGGVPANINATADENLDYITVMDVSVTGGATFFVANGVDLGNNTGWDIQPVSPRNLYWVGGSGEWMDKNHWSLSSGGTGGACIPTAYDNVRFDQNSGFVAGDEVVMNMELMYCRDMDWTGVQNTPKMRDGGADHHLNIYGSLTLSADMLLEYYSNYHFRASTPGHTITCAGQRLMVVFFETNGEWTLADDLLLESEVFHLDGILRTDNHRISTRGNWNQGVSGYTYKDPELYLGTSEMVFEIQRQVYFWVYPPGALDADESHIIFEQSGFLLDSGHDFLDITFKTTFSNGTVSNANVLGKLLFEGSGTYEGNGRYVHEVEYQGNGNFFGSDNVADFVLFKQRGGINQYAGNLECNSQYGNGHTFGEVIMEGNGWIFGNNTFTVLQFTEGNIYKLQNGTTQTIAPGGQFGAVSTGCDNFITILACEAGGVPANINATADENLDYITVMDVSVTGGATFFVANGVDLGNNTGWDIQPVSPRNLYWVGGSGEWMDKNHWSLSSGGTGGACIPTAYDNVRFDQNSGFVAGDEVVMNMELMYCRDMDWTGVQNTPKMRDGGADHHLNIYGSLTLTADMLLEYYSNYHFRASTPGHTITCAGQRLMVVFFETNGEWTLADDLLLESEVFHLDGILRTNNHRISTRGNWNQGVSGYTYKDPELYLGTSEMVFEIQRQVYFLVYPPGALDADESHIIFEQSGFLLDSGHDFLDITFKTTFSNGTVSNANVLGKLLFEGSGTYEGNGRYVHEVEYQGNGNFFGSDNVADFVLFKQRGGINQYAGNPECNSQYGNGHTFGEVVMEEDGKIFGDNSFFDLTFSPGKTYVLQSGSTQTIAALGNFTAEGFGGFPIEIKACELGNQATLHKDGDPICLDFLYLTDMVASGSGFSYAGANSDDVFNNDGWIFDACPDCFSAPPQPAPTLDPASVTTVQPGEQATLILANLPAGYEAVWFDEQQQQELYASADNLFQPQMPQSARFFGAIRELATGCVSEVLEVLVCAGPIAQASYSIGVCFNGGLSLFETGGMAANWSWTGPASFSSTEQNPVIINPTPANQGLYTVEIQDAAGCQSSDEVTVVLDVSAPDISGKITRPDCQTPVGGVDVALGGDASDNTLTNSAGEFFFPDLTCNGQYLLTPARDGDDRDGLSVLDILAIRRHILGIDPLPSPYRIIEADVNRSNAITTFDAIQIQRLILGIDLEFASNTAWRFVPADVVFPNQFNPFDPPFPEEDWINPLLNDSISNFYAMKTGDVVGCGTPHGPAEVKFIAEDKNISCEDWVGISVESFSGVKGFQFSLEWDVYALQFLELDVVPGNAVLNGFSAGNFNLLQTANGALSVLWFNPDDQPMSLPDGTELFRIRFKNTGNVQGPTTLSFTDNPTIREVVDSDLIPHDMLQDDGILNLSSPPQPVLDAASVTSVLPGQSATLILENLPAGFAAVWYDSDQITQLYADNANFFQPQMLASQYFYGAIRDVNTGCESNLLEVKICALLAGINAPAAICSGDPLILEEDGGYALAWQWSGPGGFAASTRIATDNNTGAPGSRVYSVVVTDDLSCPATASVTVVVNLQPQDFAITGQSLYCTPSDPGAPIGLSDSEPGVNYQLYQNGNPVGAPVAGTGNPIVFGLYPAGAYTVLATVAGGCNRWMSGSFVIGSFNCTIEIADPCSCKNNATNLLDGQFDERVKINAPDWQTWTVKSVSGFYLSSSPTPPAAPLPITAGMSFNALGGNMFDLPGILVDAVAYTITATNGTTDLSIPLRACYYPNPNLLDVGGPYCLHSPDLTLAASVENNPAATAAYFTVNGNVYNATFNVATGHWEANYDIVAPGAFLVHFTFDAGTPAANNPADPGCVQQSAGQFFNVIVTPDQLACNDLVTLSLDADCEEWLLPDMVLEGTYGCFDDYIVEIDRTPPFGNGPWMPALLETSDIGKTWFYRVTHLPSGNVCWGNVKVEDKIAPALSCEPFAIPCNTPDLTPGYLQSVLNIQAAIPVATDCQNVTLTYIDTEISQNCASGLTAQIHRKWTAVDASGNTALCTQIIDLIRPSLNDLTLPPDYDDFDAPAFTCNDGAYPTPDWIEAQGEQGYPYVFGQPSGCSINWEWHDFPIQVCDGTYKIRRDWTVVDWCSGEIVVHNQWIKVLDNQAPTLACPPNMTVSVDPFSCCGTIDLPDLLVEDHCSRINNISGMVATFDAFTNDPTGMYLVGGTLQDFPGNNHWDPDTMAVFGFTPCLPEGTHQVTYIVEDDCGNTRQCNFRLKVEDLMPPVAVCDQTTVVSLTEDGEAIVLATTFDDGSYDNCCLQSLRVARMSSNGCGGTNFSTSVPFCCNDVGEIRTVIFRVTDCNGNTNDCMIQVEVQDKIKPVCLPPANVTVDCENFDPSLWAYGKAEVADNCCLDENIVYQGQEGLAHNASYAQFDTVCNKGTITRTFRAFDCHGFSSQCTQRVVVTYNQDYYVKFPNDAIVTFCDGSGIYDEPRFFGEDCELLAVSYTDEIFTVVPDACFKIERTWQIINWCTYNPNIDLIHVPNPNPNPITNAPANLPGPTVSACGTLPPWAPTSVRINPTDPQPTNFCTFWQKDANGYKYKQVIKIIDTQAPTGTYTAPDCTNQNWYTPNDPQLWNEMYWWDNTIGSHDLCEEPTDLCITATDACSGSNINIEYLLFLDLDGDGVMETVVNSVNTGIAGLGWNNVLYNNLNTPNYSGGVSRQFDGRPVPQNQKWGFAIQETVSGNDKTACVRFNTQQQQNTFVPAQLPHGTHKIKWFISDGCGNNKEYEYTFTVKDCKAPTVVCLNGLSANIMPTGMITLWASDFLQYTEDNCTPAGQIKIGIRKCGDGTGFPVDGNGNPITQVTFTCDELGTQCVELWAIDAAGNADYCETYVIVQDNLGNCPNPDAFYVAGVLSTETQDAVLDATVYVDGTTIFAHPFFYSDLSDENGFYGIPNSIPAHSMFTITPEKNDNPLNGVTTYDLVLISRHILGVEPLNSPYKMIAADANKSGSITNFDIVELRKLILGVYNELPANTSWRFVDKGFAFPNQYNPFQSAFPEVITVPDVSLFLGEKDFLGVKVGDVNNSVQANATMPAEERSSGTAIFDVEDREVKAGEEFEVTFKAAEALKGFQFTLSLDGLRMEGVKEEAGVGALNFGRFDGATTVSIDGAQAFTLRFRAEKSGKLSQMLGVSGSITRAEAYGAAGHLGVAFRFDGKTIAGLGFELYQNQPNPFVNKTFIGFYLPEAAEATLTVFDETGRVVYQQKAQFAKGENAISLDRALLNTTGMLYYKLETATDSATKKMIQAK